MTDNELAELKRLCEAATTEKLIIKLRAAAESHAEDRRVAEFGPGGGNPDAKRSDHLEWLAADMIERLIKEHDKAIVEAETKYGFLEYAYGLLLGSLSTITHNRQGCFLSYVENWEKDERGGSRSKPVCIKSGQCVGCMFADIARKGKEDAVAFWESVRKFEFEETTDMTLWRENYDLRSELAKVNKELDLLKARFVPLAKFSTIGVSHYGYKCAKCGALKSLLCRHPSATCDVTDCNGIAYLTHYMSADGRREEFKEPSHDR